LRLTFYTTGFVIGPLAAMGLMKLSGGDFRLVFWIAVIPAVMAIAVLLFGIKERVPKKFTPQPLWLRRSDLALFANSFWWAIAIASLLSLARFSYAFLILKAHSIGIDATFLPIMLVLMHLVYAAAAYPFGVLADHINRRLQFGIGAAVLTEADIVLATTNEGWMIGIGAGLWVCRWP
jgi:MFS family permease